MSMKQKLARWKEQLASRHGAAPEHADSPALGQHSLEIPFLDEWQNKQVLT